MRKLMLFILLPIMAWSQTISQSGGVVTIGGDLKYGFIHAVGSADSQSVALTVTQNVYKKMAITGMAWREADGDTAGLTMDGSEVKFVANCNTAFYYGSNLRLYMTATETQFPNVLPITSDTYSFGSSTRKLQNYWGSDNIYLGGKGQTATQYISQENTIAGTDSSMKLWVDAGQPKLEMRMGATDASSSNGKLRTYFGPDTLMLLNGAKTGRDSSTYILPSGKLVAATLQIGASNFTTTKIDTIFIAGYVPRWVQFTSAGKTWLSPVYAAADTTGKW